MGAYPFIFRLFAFIFALIAFIVFLMLYVIKWLYRANRKHGGHIIKYGSVRGGGLAERLLGTH